MTQPDILRSVTRHGRQIRDHLLPAASRARIKGEYHEMPGLNVTACQAERLWELDSTTCAFVLTTLIDRGFLRRTPRGVRSDTRDHRKTVGQSV